MGKRLAAIQAELDEAEREISAMKGAASMDDLERHWKEFLGRLVRVWYKTQASLKGDPRYHSCPTVTRMNLARKEDELIKYLHMARHTEEHTVNPVVRRKPGSLTINGVGPSNFLYLRSAEIRNGKLVHLDAPLGARVETTPPRLDPEALLNKYGTFAVPTVHQGRPLESPSIFLMADLGLRFYRDAFAELEEAGWDA